MSRSSLRCLFATACGILLLFSATKNLAAPATSAPVMENKSAPSQKPNPVSPVKPNSTIHPANAKATRADEPPGQGTSLPSQPAVDASGSIQTKPEAPSATAPDKASDKTLIIVNGVKITRDDFDQLLEQKGVNPRADRLTAEMIDAALLSLTDSVLHEQYLTRTGQINDSVLQERLLAARRALISEYFAWVVGRNTALPDEKEVDQYVKEHPETFNNRRFYYYTSIAFIAAKEVDMSQINKMASSSNGYNEITEYLDNKKIRYTQFRGYRPSEQIEEWVLQKMTTMSAGEGAVILSPEKDSVAILKLFNSTPDPIDPNKYRQNISRAIIMGKIYGVIEEATKQLRDSANIQYIEKPKPTNAAQVGKFYTPSREAQNTALKAWKQGGRRSKDGKSIDLDPNDSNKELAFENIESGAPEKGYITVQLRNYIKSIWFISLIIIFPAAFNNFIKVSNANYALVTPQDSRIMDPAQYRSLQIKRLWLDPLVAWIIGVLVFGFLAYTSWKAILQYYDFIGTKQILKSAAAALIGSIALLFIGSRIFSLLPKKLRTMRFLVLGAVVITQVAVLKLI